MKFFGAEKIVSYNSIGLLFKFRIMFLLYKNCLLKRGKSFSILRRIKRYVQDNKIQYLHPRDDCRNNSNWNAPLHWTDM